MTPAKNIANLLKVFSDLPSNYSFSFLRALSKKKLNLPIQTLFPRVSACGTFYQDLSQSDINFAFITV